MEVLENLGVYPPKLIAQLINFSIVMFVLWRFGYKPVLSILDQRREKIEASLKKAEDIDARHADAKREFEQLMVEANRKAEMIISEARASADALGSKKVQEAVAQAEAVLKKAEAAAERDRQQMLSELKSEMGRLVVDTTARVVGKTLTDEDRKRLQAETLEQLAR